ncbi:MAG: proteasome subunit alpha [Myxococcota bacterium]|nr:proteasome subunit alpha [Myxococcota bacterium]
MPFYVSPEQIMADKAEFARKGIARGKSIVALEYETGILLMAENATKLNKIGEIYDRVAFAGVGKFSEFDQLRKLGVRYADTKGYAYSREDVVGQALANAYSQAMGEVFTRDPKPLEVEVIVAEVGDDRFDGHGDNALYRIKFDGFISDHRGFCVIGGEVDDVESILQTDYAEGMNLSDAASLGQRSLARVANGAGELSAESIEVCVLERTRVGRMFRRLAPEEVRSILGS